MVYTRDLNETATSPSEPVNQIRNDYKKIFGGVSGGELFPLSVMSDSFG